MENFVSDWGTKNASIEPKIVRFCGSTLFVSKWCTKATVPPLHQDHWIGPSGLRKYSFYAFAASVTVAAPIWRTYIHANVGSVIDAVTRMKLARVPKWVRAAQTA
ncbi:hypothetical protein [Yoonia vestfoldensis]|uniref:hypothetical protein n=1 Tax=Yoonia vestfoldensis TaxID=245188 RepID=UPI0013A5435E|nr:hypothetical protein [Yoonia vestfoldensis]